ncbi:FkbM family methyltransferase [Roseomonas sp. CECT 9278]|uniref:FkbM family methyltransferase n=1 Tax=Roseomonas sp. CECT 9278 TaxID=2845823 RepID=UPI001E3A7611|nr:FkbM family methyltransferase [Roseomonas sp. CECT 9278]CAH0202683.1 hypothetical protein ROS9278_01965 [Roseomonas sp. CECT 9278]
MHLYRRIAREHPGFAPARIFDIGANVGQTVRELRATWPDAVIDAFEPIRSTFEKLRANTAGDPALTLHRLAFGARPGRVSMLAKPGSPMNRILRQPGTEKHVEEVELVAGDVFCAAQGIDRLDILKIDTEGHDLEVLAGFHRMIADRRAEFVIVEVGIVPDGPFHVPYARVAEFMFAFGYGLYQLFPGGRMNFQTNTSMRGLSYANAVFVAEPWASGAASD